jgi:hypothetical protein
MGAAAGAAGGLALASTAVKMFGDYESSRGVAAGDKFRAAELDRSAQYGDLKANQAAEQMTRNLSITLAHIDATRAAGHTDPFSPTGMAVRGATEQIGTEQETMKVASIKQQALQDEADAAYERFAGSQALLAGDISMAGDALSGLSGAFKK